MLRSTAAKLIAVGVIVPAGFLASMGAITLRDSLANSTRREISYPELIKASPRQGWFHVSGCRLDFGSAVVETSHNVAVRAWVPVFDARKPDQQTTRIFAEMDDRKTLSLFIDMQQQGLFHTASEQQRWWKEHAAQLVTKRDVSGLVTRGIYRPTENLDRRFAGTADTSSDQFIVIANGWEPNPSRGYIMAGIGAIGLLYVAGCALSNRKG
jgi:hypothetical protein